MTKIACIANNGNDGNVEVPLWLCPCAECTKLDWEALTQDGETLRLHDHRHECFPEFWTEAGTPVGNHAAFRDMPNTQARFGIVADTDQDYVCGCGRRIINDDHAEHVC